MFIQNLNLRKRLGIKLLEADAGAGVNGSDNTSNTDTQDTSNTENQTTEKTFTQADVDKLIKERLAREKKGQPSKEELKAYNDWKESQKTESEKQQEALTNAEKARIEAEKKAIALEAKVACLSKGVNVEFVDDVVVLAKSISNDKLSVEQAIDKVLAKYPSFKSVQQQDEQKGFIFGANGQKQKGNPNDALARAFGNK